MSLFGSSLPLGNQRRSQQQRGSGLIFPRASHDGTQQSSPADRRSANARRSWPQTQQRQATQSQQSAQPQQSNKRPAPQDDDQMGDDSDGGDHQDDNRPPKRQRTDKSSPAPILGIHNLSSDEFDPIMTYSLGLCPLRRESAELIRSLPKDTHERFLSVMELKTFDKDYHLRTARHQHPGEAFISEADRVKYVGFRRKLLRELLPFRSRWQEIEDLWLRNLPMGLVEFDQFITTYQNRGRPDIGKATIALAIYPRVDVRWDWSRVQQVVLRHGFTLDRAFCELDGYVQTWEKLIRMLPPWVGRVQLAASYLPPLVPPPRGPYRQDWENCWEASAEARHGYDRHDPLTDAIGRYLNLHAPHVETVDIIKEVVGMEQVRVDACGTKLYDEWSWI